MSRKLGLDRRGRRLALSLAACGGGGAGSSSSDGGASSEALGPDHRRLDADADLGALDR